ncbi:hypothetical protein GALL_518760 [mine drainage metagenome]|uniref:Uncharacterized protein n=1 Tax=mine drainage metagenome TaxID=410659 RepID=A0A1J5PFF6_9ZZZZ
MCGKGVVAQREAKRDVGDLALCAAQHKQSRRALDAAKRATGATRLCHRGLGLQPHDMQRVRLQPDREGKNKRITGFERSEGVRGDGTGKCAARQAVNPARGGRQRAIGRDQNGDAPHERCYGV